MRRAEIHRHRGSLQLERAARLEHAGHRAVETIVRRCVAERVGVVIGQADHGDHFAGAHIHHDPARADRLELVLGFFQLVAHHRLHTHIDRQAHRIAAAFEPFLEGALHAGHAVAVHIHAAQHLGRDTPQRITPFLARLEINAGNAQRVDRHFLGRGDLALEVDELLGRTEPRHRKLLIKPRQHLLQFVRGVRGIDHLLRVGKQRRGRQGDRQDLAVTIQDRRPWAADIGNRRPCIRRLGTGVGGNFGPRCRSRRRHRKQHGRHVNFATTAPNSSENPPAANTRRWRLISSLARRARSGAVMRTVSMRGIAPLLGVPCRRAASVPRRPTAGGGAFGAGGSLIAAPPSLQRNGWWQARRAGQRGADIGASADRTRRCRHHRRARAVQPCRIGR